MLNADEAVLNTYEAVLNAVETELVTDEGVLKSR